MDTQGIFWNGVAELSHIHHYHIINKEEIINRKMCAEEIIFDYTFGIILFKWFK